MLPEDHVRSERPNLVRHERLDRPLRPDGHERRACGFRRGRCVSPRPARHRPLPRARSSSRERIIGPVPRSFPADARAARRAAVSEHEHRVTERIEAIPLADGEGVELARPIDAGERHHEGEKRGPRQVEVREQRVDPPEREPGRDEEIGAALAAARRAPGSRARGWSSCPPRARARRSRCAPTRPAPPGSALRGSRAPRLAPCVSGRNVSSPTWSVMRSWSSAPSSSGVKCRPAVGAAAEPASSCVHGLVALGVVGSFVDVRRKGHLPRGLAREADDAISHHRARPRARRACRPSRRGPAGARPPAAAVRAGRAPPRPRLRAPPRGAPRPLRRSHGGRAAAQARRACR